MSYARQYSMVRLSDGSSILPGSTKLLWTNSDAVARESQPEQYCGADLVSTAIRMVEGSCREGRTPSPVFQTKNAKSILVKAIAFVKSLFVMPEFGMESAASLA